MKYIKLKVGENDAVLKDISRRRDGGSAISIIHPSTPLVPWVPNSHTHNLRSVKDIKKLFERGTKEDKWNDLNQLIAPTNPGKNCWSKKVKVVKR